jgi:hypothetical protein
MMHSPPCGISLATMASKDAITDEQDLFPASGSSGAIMAVRQSLTAMVLFNAPTIGL